MLGFSRFCRNSVGFYQTIQRHIPEDSIFSYKDVGPVFKPAICCNVDVKKANEYSFGKILKSFVFGVHIGK